LLTDTPSSTNPLGPIDLTRLPALRSVVFRVPHVWANGDPTCLWFPWVSSILTHAVLPPHLVHLGLVLELDFDDEWMVDTMGGGDPGLVGTGSSIVEMELDRVLDDGLKRERYPDLKRVVVELLVRDVELCKRQVENSERARRWFPVLESRGLLMVGVGAVQEP
jgi:hypothetical protein